MRHETPVLREAARVLLIDARDRILLFRVEAASGGRSVWITPGGGLKAGESHVDGARRELWEETGIHAEPGPLVWVRRHVFRFGERLLDEREQFFVVRIDDAVLTRDHWEAHEHTFLLEHRWWTMEDMIASKEWFAPRRMAELLPAVLAGVYPAEAIDTGP